MSEYKNYARVRPIDLVAGDRIAIKVVAVVGYAGDWTAYFGLSDWSDDRVAESGDKVDSEAAVFPN